MLKGRIMPALLVLGALAACDANTSGAGDDAEDAAPVTSATDAEDSVSILRPEIEQPDAPEPEPEPRDLEVVIGFPEGGSELDDAALLGLQEVLASPQIALGGDIILRGHSGSGGQREAVMRASQTRAERVRDWLLDNGVEAERIEIIAFGAQNPVAPNALPDGTPDEGGRALNRRVEVAVLLPRPEPEATLDEASTETGD